MIEMIFKGKTKDDANEWIESCNINTQYDIYGEKHVYIGLHTESKLYPLQKNISWIEVVPETVARFTGLTDKNGVKIFEGDLIKGKYSWIYLVEYCEEYAGFVAYTGRVGGGGYCETDTYYYKILQVAENGNIEVVGNIYDNPKLLEKNYE